MQKDEKDCLGIKNASQLPKRYFGLHMVEGVAEYKDIKTNNGEPFRVLVSEKTIKDMDKTFEGRPLYVMHSDVDLENIQAEADGYVVRSFFNKADGKHWAEFLVVSDRGHEAITRGWKLSNAYIMKDDSRIGGSWHGVDYTKEVTKAEYEHLALVPNPRYQESIILTPEQFKAYNDQKEMELLKLANSADKKPSKGDKVMKFSFFKKEKLENSADLESMSVVLPKSKVEKTVAECIELADKLENMHGYANGDHFVKVDEEEMSVNQLIEKYQSCVKKMNDDAKKAEEGKSDAIQPENETDKEDEKKKENEKEEDEKENEEDEDKKENEDEKENEKEDKKENSLGTIRHKEYFEKLSNAHKAGQAHVVETAHDMVSRGKQRYGSK